MPLARYRKLPVEVEASVYEPGMEDGFEERFDFAHDDRETKSAEKVPYINTLEGRLYISAGDYIITGVQGERYPCKPDIFEACYELV